MSLLIHSLENYVNRKSTELSTKLDQIIRANRVITHRSKTQTSRRRAKAGLSGRLGCASAAVVVRLSSS